MTPRPFRRCALPFIALLVLLVPPAAKADGLSAGADHYLRREVRLNDFRGSGQDQVALTLAADGGLVATWESRRQQDGRYGVYARRLDAWGSALGGELPVNLGRGTHHQHPAVAAGAQGAWLVWEAWGLDGSAQGILARREGGDELLLNLTRAGSQERPVALALAGGGFLAAWTSPGAEPGSSRLCGRLVAADGQPIGGELALAEGAGALDRLPALAALADGGFAIAWQRQVPGLPEAGGVLLRRFDAAGQPLGPECLAAAGGIEPSLVALPGDALALAWMEREGIDWRARLARVDAWSLAPSGEPLAPGAALGGWQSGVTLAANAAGELAVAWNQLAADGESADVYARRYGADGEARGPAFRVNALEDGWQAMAAASGAQRLVLDADGRLAVAWAGDAGQGDASAANLTLLLPAPANPAARLALAARLGWAGLSERLRPGTAAREAAAFAAGAALPHQPPLFDPDFVAGERDPEPSWPGSRDRDAGWQAIPNTGWTPPDPHMAVSADHVMATVNGGLAAFLKDGTPLWQTPIEGGSGFWGSLGAGSFVFDPEVIFDPIDERFMAMACERTSGQSYFLFALSASADPTGAWHKYRFNVTSLAGGDIDSPNMAVDEQAVYLTADFFGPDKYLVYTVSKASVLGGGAAVTRSVLHTGTQSMGLPVEVTDAPAMYMIHASETVSANTITFWAVQNPLGTPSLVSTSLNVATWWDPPAARSLGTSAQAETFEARFWSCVYRDGYLWACHHVAPSSLRNSVAARWYQFAMNGWPTSGNFPTLVQSGQVQPGNTGYATFNSIGVNALGDAAMCFAYSSTSEYFSIQRCYRAAGDAQGTMQDPVRIKESQVAYTQSRWGDYSATVVDPGGVEFWMIHEYALGAGSWSTWVSHFLEDLTAAPTAPLFASAGEAWPNPARGETTLRFTLGAEAAELQLDVFAANGRRVRSIARGGQAAGELRIAWDGEDDAGRPVAAGLYFTRLRAGGRQVAGPKLTLLR